MTQSKKNKLIKLLWMFTPLGVLFILLFFIVADLKLPTVKASQCTVLAKGTEAFADRKQATVLYANSKKPMYDISLHCDDRGKVMVNDFDIALTHAEAGDQVVITQRQYKYLPNMWSLDITHPTTKPE